MSENNKVDKNKIDKVKKDSITKQKDQSKCIGNKPKQTFEK